MKNLKPKTKILFCISLVLLFVSIASSINFKKSEQEFSELLLNDLTKNVVRINISFEKEQNKKNINLKKINGEFFLIANDKSAYKLKENIIANFFTALTTKNKILLVSKNKTTELKNFVDITLYSESEKIISQIRFGDLDVLGLNRYVQLGTVNIYKLPDIYSALLNAENSAWIETQIFKNLLRKNSVQSIYFNDKIIVKNSENKKAFTEFEKVLQSFHVLDVFDNKVSSSNTFVSNEEKIKIILGDSNSFEIRFSHLLNKDYKIFNSNDMLTYIASNYAVDKIFYALKFLTE